MIRSGSAVRFTVDGRPQPKQRARRDPRSGRWFTPTPTKVYERDVGNLFLSAAGRLLPCSAYAGAVRVSVVWCYGGGARVDGDNVMKAVKDALNGVAYADDAQVVEEHCRRVEDGRPRTDVEVVYL